mgnify:CR=1 FL=1
MWLLTTTHNLNEIPLQKVHRNSSTCKLNKDFFLFLTKYDGGENGFDPG